MIRHLSALAVAAVLCLPLSAMAEKNIPVKRVVLSTSGLAYFEHGTQTAGDETLTFTVRENQVNDLLKSLLIFDAAGQVENVTFPGKEPLTQTFRDLPFDENALNDPVALLNAYQGAKVTIADNGKTYTGLLVKIVAEVEIIDDKSVTRNRISILTDDGLKTFVLEDVQSINLADKTARDDIETALKTVRENGQDGRRTLSIDLAGDETRNINLGYVVEAPLWKTAYRAVLPQNDQGKGFLQGWAIVENMTGGDWQDVKLTLTSGNPVTIRQDLYPAYYVDRPEVPVEVFGRIMPRQDQGDMALPTRMMSDASVQESRAQGFAGTASNNIQAQKMARSAGAPEIARARDIANARQAAQSRDAAAQMVFDFPGRFDLQSGKTMMLPMISRDIPMESVSLYQPDVEPRHPFMAVSLKNDGDSSLPPGILTLYDESGAGEGMRFVGDGNLDMLPKGEERMISYALDQKTTIDRRTNSKRYNNKFSISEGVLRISVHYTQTTDYTIKAPQDAARTVIIEHPRRGGYELDGKSKDITVTQDHYRIRIPVKAGSTATKKVTLTRTAWETMGITDMPLARIMSFASSSGEMSDDMRRVFEKLAQYRRAIATVEDEIRRLENRRQEIYNDQKRLRENLQSLKGESDLRDRYLDRLDDQEDELEDINSQIQDAQKRRTEREEDLQEYVRDIKM